MVSQQFGTHLYLASCLNAHNRNTYKRFQEKGCSSPASNNYRATVGNLRQYSYKRPPTPGRQFAACVMVRLRDMIYDHFSTHRASLGPRMLVHAAPISSFTCFAGGESPPLRRSFPPGIVIFDTVYVIHKLYGSYWLVFQDMFMVHH